MSTLCRCLGNRRRMVLCGALFCFISILAPLSLTGLAGVPEIDEAREALRRLAEQGAVDTATLGRLSDGLSSVEGTLAEWEQTYRSCIDGLVQQRSDTAVGGVQSLDPTAVESDESLERYCELAQTLTTAREEDLRIERALRKLEESSRSVRPWVIGAVGGLLLGIGLPLLTATVLLRRTERTRYGSRASSHPLRGVLARALIAVCVVGLLVVLPVALSMAEAAATRAEEDTQARVLLSLDALSKQVEQARKVGVLPEQEEDGTALAVWKSEMLDQVLVCLAAVRERIIRSGKVVDRLIAAYSRLEEFDRRLSLERQRLSAILGNAFVPGEDEASYGERIAALRATVLSRELRACLFLLAASAVMTALLTWRAHRSWDDRKRRGSYGGW